MDLLGQVGHPEVKAAIDRVLKAANRAKVPAGIFGVAADEINRYIMQGFQAILVGVDVAFLDAGAKGMLSQIKR
jgi:2-keto-3-deoxy-L-rhamnonate aldolase RhmA